VLSVRLLERVRDVPREAWDELAIPSSSPFTEWTWLDCLEETGCAAADAGWLPRHFTLFRGSDLVAIAPAYVKGNSEGEFVFDWSWADVAARMGIDYYPKLVFAIPFTPATGDRVVVAPGEDRSEVIAAFAEAARAFSAKAGLSSAHVLFPREEEAKAWAAAGLLPRLGVQYHWENEAYSSMDDFLARFNAKKRHQLRREIAQPGKSGITIETLPPSALDESIAKTMHHFYGATVDKFHWGRRYLNELFFSRVAARFADRLAWVVAKKGGAPVAGAFNVKKGDRLYGRYWGASQEAASEPFLHFNVCYYHGVRECIAEGRAVFEPGAGGEHKKARGFLPTLTHSAHWVADARLRRLLAAHLEREREAVAAHVVEERALSGLKGTPRDKDSADGANDDSDDGAR
jgi:predicted N-acyltransferase